VTVVRIEVHGVDELIAELRRLGGPPDFRIIKRLNDVHEAHFNHTQALTHVISGSLRASGKTSYDWDPITSHWHGELVYAGALVRGPTPAPGLTPSQAAPNDPVEYALYEMARGGHHDFFRDFVVFIAQ